MSECCVYSRRNAWSSGLPPALRSPASWDGLACGRDDRGRRGERLDFVPALAHVARSECGNPGTDFHSPLIGEMLEGPPGGVASDNCQSRHE